MSDTLAPGQELIASANQKLTSADGRWELIMQNDGNLVLYRVATHHAVWATNTNGKDVKRAVMQTDGNLVLYTFGNAAVWSSKTNGKNNSYLVLQSDGNVVIYLPRVAVWASNTNQA